MAADLTGNLGQLPREIVGDELVNGDPPLVELLEPLTLLSLQPRDVAFELVNVRLPCLGALGIGVGG